MIQSEYSSSVQKEDWDPNPSFPSPKSITSSCLSSWLLFFFFFVCQISYTWWIIPDDRPQPHWKMRSLIWWMLCMNKLLFAWAMWRIKTSWIFEVVSGYHSSMLLVWRDIGNLTRWAGCQYWFDEKRSCRNSIPIPMSFQCMLIATPRPSQVQNGMNNLSILLKYSNQ